jgi:glycosyltransferase involved in cell wall biosynthesis
MKKLAVIVDTFPRWSERFIARELRELARQGVYLTVFCLKAGNASDTDHEWDGLRERRVVLPASLLPARIPSGIPQAQRERFAAVKKLFGCNNRAIKFGALLREGGCEHLHAHFASLPSTLGWLAAGLAGIPFSLSVHARDVFVEAQLLREKCADAAAVFTCHPGARDFLKKTIGVNTTLMPHGLPLDKFPYAPRGGSLAKIPRLAAVGRFVPKKGFDTLLDAAADPALQAAAFELHLIGEGPERARLQKRILRLGLQGKARIIEPLYGAELRREFDAADALIAPFQQAADGDMDGVPNVVLEAFALGLPVIGTQSGSLGAVLTPETGEVVPAQNPAALARALASFIASPARLKPRSVAARSLVETRYDIRRNMEPLLKLLRL